MAPIARRKIDIKYLTGLKKKAVTDAAFAWSALSESDRKLPTDLLDF